MNTKKLLGLIGSIIVIVLVIGGAVALKFNYDTPERKAKQIAATQKAEELRIETERIKKIDRLHMTIKAVLKDPDSAKFGEFIQINDTRACIAVNSKNSFGGYTGEKYVLLESVSNEWSVPSGFGADFSDGMCRIEIGLKKLKNQN